MVHKERFKRTIDGSVITFESDRTTAGLLKHLADELANPTHPLLIVQKEFENAYGTFRENRSDENAQNLLRAINQFRDVTKTDPIFPSVYAPRIEAAEKEAKNYSK